MLELSPDLQMLLVAAITFLVTEGLKGLGALLKIDVSGAASAIIAALVALVLALVNGWLAAIPADYVEPAKAAMALIVAIVGSFGVHKTVKRFG